MLMSKQIKDINTHDLLSPFYYIKIKSIFFFLGGGGGEMWPLLCIFSYFIFLLSYFYLFTLYIYPQFIFCKMLFGKIYEKAMMNLKLSEIYVIWFFQTNKNNKYKREREREM